MAVAYTYPGVYIQELPSPVHTINGVQTAIAAIIGAAARGPLNEPVAISSVADYIRTFGSDGSLPLDRAVSLFYANGGGDAVIVRVGPGTLVVAAPPPGALPGEIRAISPGAWGNNLSVAIDQTGLSKAQQASMYTLTVTDKATNKQERYIGIAIDPASPRSLQRMLANSSLITAVAPAAPPATPARTPAAAPAAGDAAAAPAAGGAPTVPPVKTFQLQGGDAGTQQPTEPDLLGSPDISTGFYAAAKHHTFFNQLVLTPVAGPDVMPATLSAAAVFAQAHRAMLIADAPQAWTTVALAVNGRDGDFFDHFGAERSNAAVYFPRLETSDASGNSYNDVGPSAAIAGLYAATDAARGVWKAPAGISTQLSGVDSLALRMSDDDNGQLNPIAVNCLRTLPVVGNVVFGARTMAGDDFSASQWKYVPVRRLALFIEESLYRGTQWVVFEPNDEPLWAQVRLNIGAFMHDLFRQGAFQGTSAKDAYFVKCDSDTNPQNDIDRGILNVIVGFAPLKPAEFVVISIQQITPAIAV